MTPLVSIMTPCYNARRTLPTAVASLVLQTQPDWECIIIDDGSSDGTDALFSPCPDERIRYVRLPANRGRGVARQAALDRAHGHHLAFLDADDWWYPEKLERQLHALERTPGAAVVSTGMAIVSEEGELSGVRRAALPPSDGVPQWPALGRLERPAIAFPTCMVRMDAARTSSYDPQLDRAQDFAFMLPILQRFPRTVVTEPFYAYQESAATKLNILIETRRFDRSLYWSHRTERPLEAAYQSALATAKEAAYRAGRALGLEAYLVGRRSQRPTEREAAAFRDARERIADLAARLFPSSLQ